METNESNVYVGHNRTSSPGFSSGAQTLISQESYQYFAYLCYTFMIPSICICGFAGNSMAIAVLYRTARQFKQSIYIYMCALTIFDTVYMIISLLRSVLAIIKNLNIVFHNHIFRHGSLVLLFFDMSISDSSVFMLIILSVERFIAIRNPMGVKGVLIAKMPFAFILGSCGFVICLTVPLFFFLDITEVVRSDNLTDLQYTPKPTMIDALTYYIGIHSVLLNYIPFIIILALNIAIPIQYSISAKRLAMSAFSNSADNQLRLVATVFVVTLMYTVLALPQICIETLSVIDERYSLRGPERHMFLLVEDVNNVLTNLNMAIDFIIYILMSRVYRKRFMAMFCPKREYGDSGLYIITSSLS